MNKIEQCFLHNFSLLNFAWITSPKTRIRVMIIIHDDERVVFTKFNKTKVLLRFELKFMSS